MNANNMKLMRQDRLSTFEEVRRATSSTEERVLDFCQVQGDYCQMDSDLGGIIRYTTEELEFFASLSELDESVAN